MRWLDIGDALARGRFFFADVIARYPLDEEMTTPLKFICYASSNAGCVGISKFNSPFNSVSIPWVKNAVERFQSKMWAAKDK